MHKFNTVKKAQITSASYLSRAVGIQLLPESYQVADDLEKKCRLLVYLKLSLFYLLYFSVKVHESSVFKSNHSL